MGRTKAPSQPPAPKGSILALLDAHLEALRVRAFSEMTLKSSRYLLVHFCTFAKERGVLTPGEVTLPFLKRYQAYLYRARKKDGTPLSFRTQSIYLMAVKMFCKWLCKEGYLPHNPAGEIELPRMGRRLPGAALTITEMETLLALPDLKTPLGLRDRAVLEVLYSTGIRRGELVHLLVADLDFERGLLFVREGKGKKDRYVPVGERALLWVRKYLVDGRPHLLRGMEEKELFLTQEGTPLQAGGLTNRLRRYFLASGLEKKGSCHIFRHTAATLMLEGGADIRHIQEMLGHSALTSTQVYTHVSVQKLKEVHTRTHPAKAKSHVASDQEIPRSSHP